MIGGTLEALRAIVAPERPAAQALAVALWWQSTVLLALGLLAARALRRRPARSHAVLCVALAASLLAPIATVAADRAGLGFWTAPPAVAGDEAESQPTAPRLATAPTAAIEPTAATATAAPASPAVVPAAIDAPTAPPVASASNTARLDGATIFTALWAALSALVLAALLLAWRRTRRLLRAAAPCEDAWLELALRRVQRRLGVREVELLASPDVRTPVLWGFGRPRLVLPAEGTAAERARIAWEPVLAHELAHLRRGDHRARLLGQLALVALPLQPLLWLARRELARSSEQACDDWALQDGAPAADYADSLLAFAAGPRASLAIGAVGRRGDLRERVARIVRAERVAPRAGRGFSIALLVSGALLLAGLACVQTRPGEAPVAPAESPTAESPADNDAPPADVPATSTLAGRVVNEEGESIAGAKVSFWRDFLESPWKPAPSSWSSEHPQAVLTDADGRFRLVGLRKGWVDLLVDHPDYARLFGPNGGDRPPTDHDDLVLVMHRGVGVTGRVIADGKPLAGEHVAVMPDALAKQSISLVNSVVTDADGRFAIEHAFDDVGLAPIGSYFPSLTLVLRSNDWVAPHYRVQQPREGAEIPFVEIEAEPLTPDSPDERHSKLVRIGVPTSGELARRKGEPVGEASLRVRVNGPLAEPSILRVVSLEGRATDGRELHREAPLADDGTALLDQLPACHATVDAPAARGTLLEPIELDLTGDESRELTLSPRPTRLHGRVLCAGAPYAHGYVEVLALITDPPGQFVVTAVEVDGQGNWQFSGLPLGRYRVTWSDAMERNAGLVPVDTTLDAADNTLDIDLPRTRIDVALADGTPLPDHLHLTVERPGSAPRGGNTGALLNITPTASWIEHVPPGVWTITDHGSLLFGQVTLDGPDARATVLLDTSTHGSGLITGRIAGWTPTRHKAPFEVELFPEFAGGVDITRRYGKAEVKADGSFRVLHVPTGTYGVLLMPDFDGSPTGFRNDFPCLYQAGVEVTNDKTTALTFTLQPLRSVSFQLPPRLGAYTRWSLALDGDDWIPYSEFLGSDPRALGAGPGTLPLTVGEHRVMVDLGGEPPRIVTIQVEPGDDVQHISLGG